MMNLFLSKMKSYTNVLAVYQVQFLGHQQIAIANATIKYGLMVANHGFEKDCNNPAVASGVNCYNGEITNRNVALAQGCDCAEPFELI